jgi:hypothetical protein
MVWSTLAREMGRTDEILEVVLRAALDAEFIARTRRPGPYPYRYTVASPVASRGRVGLHLVPSPDVRDVANARKS